MFNAYSSTVTQKGQATIPAPIRRKLGLKPGHRLFFDEINNKVFITPEVDISSLRGSIKTNIKWNKKKAYEAVGRMLAERYVKTLPKKFRPKLR